jgi:hypothetical protein
MQNDALRFNIDLRWSLWTESLDELTEAYPRAFCAAEQAFLGTGQPVLIESNPKKEIRFGQVRFEQGKAIVNFSFEWDEPFDQISRIEVHPDLTNAERAYALGRIANHFEDACTWYVAETVEAETFAGLIAKIDQVEAEMIEAEEEQSKAFDTVLFDIKTAICDGRADYSD